MPGTTPIFRIKYRACLLGALLMAIALMPALALAQQDARTLVSEANAAYERKDFAASGELFVKAIAAGAGAITNHYNAACAFALAGDREQAFGHLQDAVNAGLEDPAAVLADADLASLHGDPRWAPLLARVHPSSAAMASLLIDHKQSTASRYFAGRRALADGKLSAADESSRFNQFYANMAQFVGAYDEASKVYGYTARTDDPLAAGYRHAAAANAVILEQARGRQAVFLNESHGQSQTRAANYTLLAPLRAQGFKYLAMEALTMTEYVAPTASHCPDSELFDRQLAARAYATTKTGHYTQDPVFAEIIREALRLGYTLVGYDTHIPNETVTIREQKQARNLACIFQADPKARLVVIAGFSHIGERKDFWVPGGAMAYRFKTLTGIDPLTVDTTTALSLDPAKLEYAAGSRKRAAESYVLNNAAGQAYGNDNFDLVVFVPAPSHRNEAGGSWLALDGARKPVKVASGQCQGRFPCLVEARRRGEQPDAIPADRCVLGTAAAACRLYLAPGRYAVSSQDEQGRTIASLARTVH